MTSTSGDIRPESTLSVVHRSGDRFRIRVRGHELEVDQPAGDGGTDRAPTPTELFVAGLASCVALYAHRYLERHGLPADGLAVTAEYGLGTRPARIDAIRIRMTPPAPLPPERRAALLAVATHCTVHNSLADPPVVDIHLATPVGTGR